MCIKLCGIALFRNKAGVNCFFQRLALTWYDVCAVICFYIKLNIYFPRNFSRARCLFSR